MKLFKAGLLALIGTASAWNSETHLLSKLTHSTISCLILYIVARVAYDQLKTEDPQALKKAEDLLRKYSDTFT